MFNNALLADDDATINYIVEKAVSNASLAKNIIITDDRLEQVDILKHSTVDLLVVDLKNGGSRIIELARKKHPNIKILCFSGSVNENVERIVRESGANDFLAKPAGIGEITEKIKNLQIK
ncbi:MAG: hypothetical protein A2271_04735 [Candidatus Moranbacteria bacterium RIFOXYA12_FULL_35_19]|nr:MAG: Response regulator receiver [Candidatus Moranbacteria bacterium GW2011_GWF2_35_39]OGI30946.1 MAG: hypothetical protein A2343_03995 [Candidatus Moranbacteria bacterium RIFOXYB12_FULL_35_8]OGI35745.1 MAG: hypothetical protein A2271_04735 [Candidatus Moranbacteria bacterium RIFOXYA12_FULL_35_19]